MERSGLERTVIAQGDLVGVMPMRDWIIILAPLMATLYFLVNPDQFREVLVFVGRLVD